VATSRPFAFNTGSTISGTEQLGDLAIGVDDIDYDGGVGGVTWWMGPDEDLGYIICRPNFTGTQPNPVGIPAYVRFLRSKLKTEESFVSLVNAVYGQSFTTGNECKTYLNNNGFWTSWVSNLKLYLDASNPSSYSGAGTTWYDLSGNGNDVEMVNSGSISWSNTGPTYFSTGANGWFSNPSGSNLPIGNSNYTFIIWVQLGTVWNANGFMSIGPFGALNMSNAFRAGGTNQLINYWWGNDLSVFTSVSPTDGWFNAVAKYDGITRSIWVNGVLVGSDTPVGHNVTTNALQIAKTTSTEYLQGNVGEVLIYDTALSDSSILQYYNDTYTKYINVTPTPTVTPTNTPTITPTITPTKTQTPTPTVTPTNTVTPTITPTSTVTPSITPSLSVGVTFSQTFTSGAAPGSTIENAWTSFRSQLTGSYSTMTLSSSLGTTLTVNDPLVQNVANALKTGTTGTNFSIVIGSRTWRVIHGCVQGTPDANSIYLTSSGTCDCGGGTTYTVRPMIKNANWGGLNGSACGQPTQTLTVTFS
jgi:hypothetical protein